MEKRRLIKNIDIYTDTVSVWEYGFTCGVEKTWYIYILLWTFVWLCMVKANRFTTFALTHKCQVEWVARTRTYTVFCWSESNSFLLQFFVQFNRGKSSKFLDNSLQYHHRQSLQLKSPFLNAFLLNNSQQYCYGKMGKSWKVEKKKTLCLPWLVWCHPFRLVVNTKCNF